jgi:hypothetical protein
MSPRMFDSWPAGSSLAFLRQRNLLLPSARAWDEPTATWKLARNAESPIRSGAKTSGVVEVVEVRIAIVDDRLLDAVEHRSRDALGVVVGLEDERRDDTDQRRLADPRRPVRPQVAGDLPAAYREPARTTSWSSAKWSSRAWRSAVKAS